jgi:hypothetical protein
MKYFFAVALLLIPASSLAETALRWTDSSGNVVYGTKPPPGAKNIAKVAPKNYSRYSSSKKIAPLKSARAALKETPIKTPPEASKKTPALEETVEQKVRLVNEEPEVKEGTNGEVTSCRVMVKNTSVVDIEGVQVAFEFFDGTLIAADGPIRLNAGAAALYAVPQENLPVVLKAGVKPKPRVLINSDADY